MRDATPFLPLIEPNPARSSVNLWLGRAGAVAHAHYDGYHNFFVQIKGRKRFLLMPPHAWRTLGIYPFVHPSHAQAAANLSNAAPHLVLGGNMGDAGGTAVGADTDQALLAAAEVRVADVGPGEVLYVPPLWFHHVVAVSECDGWQIQR